GPRRGLPGLAHPLSCRHDRVEARAEAEGRRIPEAVARAQPGLGGRAAGAPGARAGELGVVTRLSGLLLFVAVTAASAEPSAAVLVTSRRTFRNLTDLDEPMGGLLGLASASSEGIVAARLIEERPAYRAGETLEAVPGVVVSQHSGEGKANQYYVRGFNLDHGTDLATFVAGGPVNMPTHAHGQGYSDNNFLIPELVSGVQFQKGTYSAEEGDFSAAGSINVNYLNALDRPLIKLEGGENAFGRVLLAASSTLGTGRVLYALEGYHSDGPW